MKTTLKNTFIIRASKDAFNNAVIVGFLSEDSNSFYWAGYYMYMYSIDNIDYFKNIETRKYLEVTVLF